MVTLGVLMMATAALSAQTEAAKADLMQLLAAQPAASVPDAARKAEIDAAAARLEASAALPDLNVSKAEADGVWMTLYSSQGIFGKIPVAFMTRALPGGGASGGTATVEQVWQEFNLESRFYRNSMLLLAGDTPIHYIATADVGVAAAKPNDLEVAFHDIVFAPGKAGVSNEDVRAALQLAPETPLSIKVPARTPSVSSVTYLDGDLRINRGKDYVAVLRKVQ